MCKHIKTSEAVNLVFQWIFTLNSVKHKFFHVGIVNHCEEQNFEIKTSLCESKVLHKINFHGNFKFLVRTDGLHVFL